MNVPVPLWSFFVAAADQYHLPVGLLAAVCARESGFGVYLDKDGTGDNGHGHGLMQIDDRSHADFCADPKLWKDPETNIMKGAEILAAAYYSADLRAAAAAGAYNAGEANVRRGIDSVTTGKNYASDVLARREKIAAPNAK